MSPAKSVPDTGLVLTAAAVSWLGLYLHNVADLPNQSMLSAESAYPAVVLLLLVGGRFTRARRSATWLLLGWAGLHLLGGALLSVLPIPWWPYHPEQTLHHYAFHALYGALQVPLLIVVIRTLRRPDLPTALRRGELVVAGAQRSLLAVANVRPSRL